MKQLVVDYGLIYNRIALVENGHLMELHIENIYDQSLVGNIYLGKVVNIVKTMSAAFIDIGEKRNAYMQLEKDLKNGSEIFVQVKRDAVGEKGATVTTDLSLSGQYVVLLPKVNHVMISKKIRNKKRVERLSDLIKSAIGSYGAVIRTEAEHIDDEILLNELEFLIKTWHEVEKNKNRILKDRVVYNDYGFEALIQKEFLSQVDELIVNSKTSYEYFKGNNVKLYDDVYPIFETFKIESQIKDSLKRDVKLHQGSFITIDETEALTAIDVNSGQFVGSSNKEETFLQVNLAAAKAVARQIRLRNISGIIIVDFINMKEQANYEILMNALKKHFKSDKCMPKIHGMTTLGLMEITRKKNRKSLKTQLLSSCNQCDGSGYVMSDVFFYKQFVEKIKTLKHHTKKSHFEVKCSEMMYNLLNQTVIGDASYLNVLSSKLDIEIMTAIDDQLEGYTFKTSGK